MTAALDPGVTARRGRLPTANWMLFVILLLLAILPALPAFAGPGSGWVKADVVSGGCVQQGGVTVCSSEVTPGSPTLYEYKPNRQAVGRNYSQSPSLASHGGYPTYEPRDACIVNGRFMYWPAGIWHHGARWTLEIRNGAQNWIGPSSQHWAFEHNDVCRAEGPNAVTPTIGSGGGMPGTPVSGPPATVTPPGDIPVSTPIPTATLGPCIDTEIIPFGPLPLGVHVRSGGTWQPALQVGAADTVTATMADLHGGMDAPALPPGPYPMIAAGTEVRAAFTIGRARMESDPANRLQHRSLVGPMDARDRNFVLALQDLGADGALGGSGANADTLLSWMQGEVGDYNGNSTPGGLEMRVMSQTAWPNYFGPNNPGWIPGWGMAAGLRSESANMFLSRSGGTYGTRATVPDLGGAQRWWITDDPNDGDAYNAWRVVFTTQPNRVYRLVATVARQVCGIWHHSSSQLLFSTYPAVQPNLSLTKSGPLVGLRGDTLEYSLFYANFSPLTVSGATLTDDLPAGVTYVSASPAPLVQGRRLSWNLGDVPPMTAGTFTVRVTVNGNAPATLTNVADITAGNDSDPRDNHAEVTTSVPQGNVTVTASAPRVTEPGQAIDLTIGYRNTTGYPVRFATLKHLLPPGVTLLASSRAATRDEDAGGGQRRLTWDLGTVPAGASATITLRVRVDDAAPNVLRNVVWIESPEDANQLDNEAETATVVLRAPLPQASCRLRIHSSLDPHDGVYLTNGSAFRWPAGEVLDFAPFVELTSPAQPPEGFYRVTQQVVAWSFVRSGGMQPGGASCKARATPTAGAIANADLREMQGCVYRYLPNPTAGEMAGMGHLYWAATPPERMRDDVYVLTPLPAGPTDLALQVAVLTTLSENGSYDLNGDGNATSVLLYRTHLVNGAFAPTLIVPRDSR